MKKRVLSMLMTLALCLTLLPAPAWAEEDTPEIGATVQQEQQEAQQEAPAAEPSTILEQAAENGIAAQNGGGSTVENAVAEVTVNGSTTTQYTDIDAAFAAAQEADSATVKLLADVTISHDDYSGIALKKGNITLDLNGKTLSKSKRDDNWFYAKNAVFWLLPPEATTKDEFLAALRMPVRLTVQDSSADENGKIVQPNGGPAVTATLNTILTVNGGTIENASSVDTPIRQINALVCSNIYLKCLIHCFQFFQNLLLCSANHSQLLNIHVFIFHTLDKLLNIGINSLGSHYLGGGINQLRQTENIILMFINIFAINVFSCRHSAPPLCKMGIEKAPSK